MNSVRAAGGRLLKLDLIHSLVSVPKTQGIAPILLRGLSQNSIICDDNCDRQSRRATVISEQGCVNMVKIVQQEIYGWYQKRVSRYLKTFVHFYSSIHGRSTPSRNAQLPKFDCLVASCDNDGLMLESERETC